MYVNFSSIDIIKLGKDLLKAKNYFTEQQYCSIFILYSCTINLMTSVRV